MTSEQLLITGMGSVVGALCYCVLILFRRADECVSDRKLMQISLDTLRSEQGALREKIGEMRGRLISYQSCPVEDCPHREFTPPHGQRIIT